MIKKRCKNSCRKCDAKASSCLNVKPVADLDISADLDADKTKTIAELLYDQENDDIENEDQEKEDRSL